MNLSPFHPILREAYEHNRIVGEDGKVYEPFPHSLSFEEGSVLYGLAREFDEPTTLETGMAYGVSTLFFCQAVRDQGKGRHISVDPYQDYWNYIGVENVRRAGFGDLHTWYEERSELQLPMLVKEGLELDLAFVDGNHRFEYAFADFFYADRMLRQGGYLILHDYHIGGIRKLVNLVLRLHGDCYRLDERHSESVTGFARYRNALLCLARAPLEPAEAVTLSRWEVPNQVVFKKYRHRPEAEWGETWKYYRSF